ncbi:MAG: hypothetical protein ACI9NN_000192, partial [Bacteroidia bacterium]
YAVDINNDGKSDLFVFDRSGSKVLCLIKQTDDSYKHQPEYDNIFPLFADWVVFKDFDGDGKPDLWFKNEAYNGSVSLYNNVTQPGDKYVHFDTVTHALRAYNFNDAPLDSSDLYCDRANIPAIEDVDGDGDIDFLTLQKFGDGITLFRNMTADHSLPIGKPEFIEADFCWGDFLEGEGNDTVILKRSQWCFRKLKKHAGGSTLLLLDGDEDNDMDLIIGNAGFGNLIYLKNGRQDLGTVQDTMIGYDATFPNYNKPVYVNIFPAPFYQDVNDDGIKELLVSVNYTDKSSGFFRETGNLLYYSNLGKNNKPIFQFEDSAFLVNDIIDFGSHTAPTFYDMDGDGDQDLVIATNGDWGITGDRHDRLVLFENIGDKNKAIYQMAANDFLELEKDSIQKLRPCFADINKDGKAELIVGEINGTLLLYNLTGSGIRAKASLVAKNSFNIQTDGSSAPHVADVDGDGNVDLLVGHEGGNTFYYKNNSSTSTPDFVLESDTFGDVLANRLILYQYYDFDKGEFYDTLIPSNFGYSTPQIMDLDGNGDPEFIVGNGDGDIHLYRNIRLNNLKNFQKLENLNTSSIQPNCHNYDFGAMAHPTIADLNGDGIPDVLVGTSRGGIQLMLGGEACNKVGVKDVVYKNDLILYPNPASQHISFKGLTNEMDVQIYTVNGLLAKESFVTPGSSIDISELSQGVYFIRGVLGQDRYHFRLVKQ